MQIYWISYADFELKNANTIEKNAPGIDLIDEKNKISIQVTSDNSSEKIKHFIEEFISNRSYEKYDRMVMLILTRKKNYTTPFNTSLTGWASYNYIF